MKAKENYFNSDQRRKNFPHFDATGNLQQVSAQQQPKIVPPNAHIVISPPHTHTNTHTQLHCARSNSFSMEGVFAMGSLQSVCALVCVACCFARAQQTRSRFAIDSETVGNCSASEPQAPSLELAAATGRVCACSLAAESVQLVCTLGCPSVCAFVRSSCV